MTVTTRAGKGSPLTNAEIDANFLLVETALGTTYDNAASGASATEVKGALDEIFLALPNAGKRLLKLVIVNEITDFPADVAGAIQLDDNINYEVGEHITTALRFIGGVNSLITGLDSSLSSLTYTGSGDFITVTNNSFRSFKCGLSATDASSNLFNISGSGSEIFQLTDTTVAICGSLGPISNVFAFSASDIAFLDIQTDGWDFSGNINTIISSANLTTLNAGIMYNLGTTNIENFSLGGQTSAILASGTFYVSGLVSSGNINTGGLGSIANTRFSGLGAPLQNISPDDARWNFILNDVIPDTRPDAFTVLSAQATTTIATANTPVKVNGVFTDVTKSQMSIDTTGKITYNGEKSAKLPVDISISLEPVSGTNKNITVYIFKNQVIETESGISVNVSSGDPKAPSVHWQGVIANADELEVYVENNDDTVNIQVNQLQFRVN